MPSCQTAGRPTPPAGSGERALAGWFARSVGAHAACGSMRGSRIKQPEPLANGGFKIFIKNVAMQLGVCLECPGIRKDEFNIIIKMKYKQTALKALLVVGILGTMMEANVATARPRNLPAVPAMRAAVDVVNLTAAQQALLASTDGTTLATAAAAMIAAAPVSQRAALAQSIASFVVRNKGAAATTVLTTLVAQVPAAAAQIITVALSIAPTLQAALVAAMPAQTATIQTAAVAAATTVVVQTAAPAADQGNPLTASAS